MKYAFVNGYILDGTRDMEAMKDKIVLVNGKKIEDIVDKGHDLSSYEVIDLQGQYLLPGLINMHVHLAGNGKPQKKQRDNTKLVNLIFSNPISARVAYYLVREYASIELNSGVTTIRTVGGLKDLDSKIRDEINEGKIAGPRIICSNEGISVPHGHMAGSVAITARSIEEAKKHVDHLKDKKADFIKLMITGGVMDAKEKGVPGQMKMDPEMIKEVCDYAHSLGYIVAAHVESSEGVRAALENGVDSIEHGAVLDEHMIELFKKKNAFVTTTISPALPYALFDRSISNASEVEQYNGNVVFEGIVECSKTCIENDIPVALGNDVGCPWVSQYDFWRELVYFHKYVGVSNQYALYSATLNNARLAGVDDVTGSIEKGKDADLIVVKDNPLEDLHTLRTVKMVMARGDLLKDPKVKRKAEVDEQLDKFM
ncbi:MAG: amidohydrolase family protein [Erysipelotrichaceae bacterium]|nr:amidohydrolase family protein [Erysipelotrichaceae bacterium]